MPKRKETKRTKTKTIRTVKSAIAKGKGIAQNQSVVVNIQKEKAKRTYKRKPKISATSQVPQSAFNYGTSAMNTTMFQQPLSNIVPPPPEFRNQVIPAPMRQSINNNVTEQPFGGQFNYPTIQPDLFDVSNRSNNFINSFQGIYEDDFNDSDSSSKEKSIRVRRLINVRRNPPVAIPQPQEEIATPQPAERRKRRTKEEMVAVKEENRIKAMIKAGERELQMRRDNPQPKKVKKKPFIA
jgi:hypothetical protein